MEFPLVSIIVPMYNTAGCIARCVKSICAQTYKSIEILLLDGGSTGGTTDTTTDPTAAMTTTATGTTVTTTITTTTL